VYDWRVLPRSFSHENAPKPPGFWFVFDWRLVAAAAAVLLVGFVSCDVVNAKLDASMDSWMGRELPAPDPEEWKPGTRTEVDLTLVTKDAERLACADDREFEGTLCEYKDDKRRRRHDRTQPADDNRVHLIQPYRTARGNHLVLVAGLWATPDIAMRRHREPARGVAEKTLRRFIARCHLRFVGEMDGVDVRWEFNKKWYAEQRAPVAVAEHCQIVRD
jgi:hypothetical protein